MILENNIDKLINKLFDFTEYKRYKLDNDMILKIKKELNINTDIDNLELFKDSIIYKLLDYEDNGLYILKTNIYLYEKYDENNFIIINSNDIYI